MGRKINAAVLGASFILPGVAGALGLGDITLNSALNQPLNADILIRKAGDLGKTEILTKLAPVKEYERSGVDRAYFLNDIQFNVEVSDDGSATIHLTTLKPVVEPFLNFILEVQWPQGKILKEFTLLLDPPVFSQEYSQAINPPVSDSAKAQQGAAQGRSSNVGDVSLPTRPGSVSSQSGDFSVGADVYGPVVRNEGLWEIAKRVRPNKSFSINQTMIAIQEKNPNAFLRNNLNLLKEGQVLRVPSAEEILGNSYQDALASVKAQNERWRKPAAQMVQEAVEVESESQLGANVEPVPESNVEGGGRLTLVAGSDEGSDSSGALGATEGEAEGASAVALKQELAVKEENLDRAVIENENLKTELEEINQQLETSAELVQLKDDQIATLQKQLAALEKKRKENPTQSQPSSADNESANGLDNPLMLAGIGAAIVALIVGLMLARRKSVGNKEDDLPEQEFDAEDLGRDTNQEKEQAEGEDVSASQSDDENLADENPASQETASKDDSVKQELGDVIGEADIYIAYGRFSHAAELLKQGCDAEPDREDIRLKLLEVLVETGDMEAFSSQDAILRGSSSESVLQAADALYVKMHGSERSDKEDAGAVSDDDFPEETVFDAVDEGDEGFASELGTDFSVGEDLEQDTDVVSFDSGEEETTGSVLVDEAMDANESDDGLSTDLEFELPDMDSGEESGFSLELDAEENEQEGADILGAEGDSGLDDADELGGLELDSFETSIDLDAVGNEGDAQAEESFDLDLDDMGELDLGGELDDELNSLAMKEEDVALDLDGLADSLDESGVDFSEAVEPLEDSLASDDTLSLPEDESLDLSESSGLELVDSSNDQAESTDLSGDINLDDDDLDLLSDLDENTTKLDLARAYLEMGDATGAKEILQEVLADGNDTQKHDAEEMLGQIA
ncbi:MAG: FimV family protein [Pseudomonadales bacterium]|nr:FimV family protein [Pseudomonadales bacterium]